MQYSRKKQLAVTDLLWPLLWAVLSVAGYFLIVVIIYLLNLLIRSTLLGLIVSAMYQLLYIIFAIALVSSYTRHFQKISGMAIVLPFLMTISITLVVYFIVFLLEEINKLVNAGFLTIVTQFVMDRILFIFIVILILSYVVMLLGKRR